MEEEKKPRILLANWAARELTGLESVGLGAERADAEDLDEEEKVLSLITAFLLLKDHISSGLFLDEYLALAGREAEEFPKQWKEQFKQIRENCFADHSRHALFWGYALNVATGGDDETLLTDLKAGKQEAFTKLNAADVSALLMIARHPDADRAFFNAILGDIRQYTEEKSYPQFQKRKPLTQAEMNELHELCSEILSIYEETPGITPNQAVAEFVRKNLSPKKKRRGKGDKPAIRGIVPDRHVIPNNKVTNALFAGYIGFAESEEDFFRVRVSEPKAKKEIITNIMVAYEGENIHIASRRAFTEYDRNVYDAIVSLYVYGDKSHTFTPAMVYRAMTHMPEASSPSPQQIGSVTKSIEKMRFTRAVIDCTEEMQRRGLQGIDGETPSFKKGRYLLAVNDDTVCLGGRTVTAYKLIEEPVLYSYSSATGQVLTVPSSLLAIKEADAKGVYNSFVSNNESRIRIKGYLLRRIEGMKAKNSLTSNIISLVSYEKGGKHHPGIYEIAGKPEPSKIEAKRIRDYVTAVLDFWKAEKYIKGHEFVTVNRSTTGVRIML